jgi:hypothetical protein
MAENGCGSILVMEGERLLGIFTERDLLTRVAAAEKSLERTHLREVMTRNPDTVRADEPVKEAIRKMDEFSYRYLPVLEDDRVIGVISTRHLPFGAVLAMQWELDERHAVAERLWWALRAPARSFPGADPSTGSTFPGALWERIEASLEDGVLTVVLPHSWPRIDSAQGEGAPDLRIPPSVNRGRMR